jgi:GNAT superfamily N-acetyltransferase
MKIVQANVLPLNEMGELLRESETAGHRFVRRLVEEWQSGENRFYKPGEAIFLARAKGTVIGIGGLNQDPYVPDPRMGRVRHLYVSTAWRRRGVGRRLVSEVLRAARPHFHKLRLRTGETGADQFYAALGFTEVQGDDSCSHMLELAGPSISIFSLTSLHGENSKGDTPLESPAERGSTPLDTPKGEERGHRL